jgi:hypothetical protein
MLQIRLGVPESTKLLVHHFREITMKYHLAFMCALGLVAAISASPSYARGVIIDGAPCPTAVSTADTRWIAIPGTGRKDNRVKAGINLPYLICTPTSGHSSLDYDSAESLLYTLIDLTTAYDTLQGVQTIAASGLSSLRPPVDAPPVPQDSYAAIVAQVALFKLVGTYQGGYEIIFNYQNSTELAPVSACVNTLKPIAPSFTWFGTRYVFTGVGGVTPCDANSTNDFVFDRRGQLVGYLDTTLTLTPGLPPGWEQQ